MTVTPSMFCPDETYKVFNVDIGEQSSFVIDLFFDTSRLVNLLEEQYKSVSAVFLDTSRLVSWLTWHHRVFSAVLFLTSRLVSWL